VLRIPFQFSLAQQFSEGLAAVRAETVRDGTHVSKFGYIDYAGTLKIPATFDHAGAFSEGIACVGRNYKFGYIDKSGSFVVEPRFDMTSSEWSTFSEGLAGACQRAADPQKPSPPGAAPEFLCGYINKTGGWIIPARYTSISAFHDGLAAVREEGESRSKYIDHSGQTVVLGPFAMAGSFSDGLARVQLMNGGEAFINREGKVQFLLDKAFHFVYPFADGMAEVVNWAQPGGYQRVGYIDRTGKMVIPQIYQAGSAFHDGIAFVASCGQSGYIGKAGEPVWGIKPRVRSSSSEAAPSSSAITPELIEKITDHRDPLTLKTSSGSGTCDPDGKKIWSVAVGSPDRTFPGLTINLLEGGTFLTEERIDNVNALRQKFAGQKGVEVFFGQPIGPESHPIGYVMTLGFGPGGSATAASVFSPGQEYEVQVLLSQGGYAREVKDPFGLTSKIALEIKLALFGQMQ
jgi:hypothetical protein